MSLNGRYIRHGNEYWYQNGQVHREDGPAIIYPMGPREWRQNGLLHRMNGPAVEGGRRGNRFFIEGVECYSEELYWRQVRAQAFR